MMGRRIIVLLAFVSCVIAAFNPHAGLAEDFAKAAVLTPSSGTVSTNLVRDGDSNTLWQSSACMPNEWVGRSYMNILTGTCAVAGRCTSSSSSTTNIAAATDGNTGTSYSVALSGGVASFNITFPTFATLFRVGLRANTGGQTIYIWAFPLGYTTPVSIGQFTTTNNWAHVNYRVNPSLTVSSIFLNSTAAFTLTELAATKEECHEYLIFDFGSAKQLGLILTKVPTDANSIFTVEVSASSTYTWTTVVGPLSAINWATNTFIFAEQTVRYAMFKLYNGGDWRSMAIYEVKLYDQYGLYGAPYPATRANPITYMNLLGINGIWGWGTQNEPALSPNTGPRLYIPVSSHARNYHNLNWDILDPTQQEFYNKSGTIAQPWLNWTVVYQNWKNAGYNVIDTSITFGNASFPQYKWPNPYQNAYNYGRNFGNNFGPSRKNLIRVAEVGNEPWDYNADFYRQILDGMSQGFKAGDPALWVLPAAFQADTPDVPANGDGISWTIKYAGYRITEASLPYLDGLNSHCYSYAFLDSVWKGVRPEHPVTNFKAFRNMMRWRDANMPGKEVWLTEWGWDGSATCYDSRCVSLASQGVYGLRGLLIGAREGLNRMSWFFYADIGTGGSVYDWSGLTKAPVSGVFAKKPVYYGLVNFLSIFANYTHLEVLSETNTAYVYILQGPTGNRKLVAWRPVDGDVSTQTQVVSFSNAKYGLANTTFVEIGLNTTGNAALPNTTFTKSGNTWTLNLSGYPRVANVYVI